ncbi:MAG: hypothetical protein LBB98_05170 [Treponema sp.]|jgi:hypothetical protein|nr:hypothetical protein [Treponema sp.]
MGTKPARAIPIVTWLQYVAMISGFFQIDLVQHDGGNPSGECGNFVSDVTP